VLELERVLEPEQALGLGQAPELELGQAPELELEQHKLLAYCSPVSQQGSSPIFYSLSFLASQELLSMFPFTLSLIVFLKSITPLGSIFRRLVLFCGLY
jgi:hypothetical protein